MSDQLKNAQNNQNDQSLKEITVELGKSANGLINSFGDKIESGFESFGNYANNTIDAIGTQLKLVPHFGQNLDFAFDKMGDSAEELFKNTGQKIDDKIDNFGDMVEGWSETLAGSLYS